MAYDGFSVYRRRSLSLENVFDHNLLVPWHVLKHILYILFVYKNELVRIAGMSKHVKIVSIGFCIKTTTEIVRKIINSNNV